MAWAHTPPLVEAFPRRRARLQRHLLHIVVPHSRQQCLTPVVDPSASWRSRAVSRSLRSAAPEPLEVPPPARRIFPSGRSKTRRMVSSASFALDFQTFVWNYLEACCLSFYSWALLILPQSKKPGWGRPSPGVVRSNAVSGSSAPPFHSASPDWSLLQHALSGGQGAQFTELGISA